VDILWTGDDFGSQTSLLISAELFREKLKPHYRKMLQAFKAENPDIIMAFHCDGAVSELLDDFVEVGYQLFNPVQPNVPKHSPRELKDGFGEKLAFWGAIDQQALLPKGDFQKIEEEVKEIIRILGENRGFIVAPAHIVQADVSPECLEHFIAVCKKHGNIYDHH
jgi:uroporphyrinogen decarboxylase